MFPQGPSGLTLFPTAAPAGSTAAPGLTLDMPQVDVEQWSDVFQCSPLSPGSQFMYEESDEALLVRSLCGGSTGLMTEHCGMLDSSQAAMFDVASRAGGSGSSCGSGSPHVFSPSFEKMKFEECFNDATAATLTDAQCGGLSGAVKIEKDLNKWSDGLSSVSTSTRCLDVSSRLAGCGTAVEDAGPTLAQLNSQDLSVLDGLEHLDSVLLGDLDLMSFDSSLLANLLSSSVTTISSTVNNNNNNNIYSNVASSPSATLSSPQQTSTPQSFGGRACGGGVWQVRKDLLDEDQQLIVLQEDCGLQEMLSNPLLAAGQDLLTLVGSAGPQQLQQINTAAVAYTDTKQLQRATSLVIGSSTFSSPLEMLPAVMRSNSSVTAADSWMGLTDQMLITSKLESPSAAITAAADIATIAAEEMVIESSPILSRARGTAAVVSTSAVAAAAGVSRVAAASAVRGKKVEQKLKQQQLVVKQLPQQQKQQRKRTRSAGDDYYNDDDDDDSDIDSEYDSDTETGRSGGEDGTGFLREFVGGGSGGRMEKRYFWQYNTQAKGPKGKRLCKTVESVDPHVLNDFEDPVFDPEQNQTKYKHNGKARRGDGNDITPNPYKLFTVGNELKKLNKLINSISPPGELPSPVRLRSLKEKNKFASRACRLKKKAQHEANKLKLFGLEQEHKQLMRVLTGIRQLIVDRMDCKQSSAALNTDNRMTNKLETLMKSHLTMMIAGHTADYVNTILQRVSEGDKSGGISLDD